MSSETSIDFNLNALDKTKSPKHIKNENSQNKKQESTDTDFYLNLIANQNKLKDDSDLNSDKTSSISDIIESDNNSIASHNSNKSTKDNDSDNSKNNSKNSSKNSSKSSSKSSSKHSSKVKHQKIHLPQTNIPQTNIPQTNIPQTNIPQTNIPQTNIPPLYDQPKKELSPQEVRMKKIELLRRLSELKAKGYELSKNYDFNSSTEEMEYEYDLLKSFTNKRNGVKLYKNILLNTVSAIEFLNDKYDPFDFELNGWSEHMSVEADSYDEVLEELYEKYKGSGKKMPAEMKLLMLIVASGSAFHLSKSTFKNLPGVDKVLQNNPDLIAKMINPKKETSQFMSEQEINLEKQKQMILEREKAQKKSNNLPPQKMNSFFNNNFSPYNKEPISSGIKAPLNVQEILNKLHNSDKNKSVVTETQEESSSNNDRIVGNSDISSSMNSSEKKTGKKQKSIMTIS